MASFDFITDEGLRASLEHDYAEVHACIQSRAWKAVHVLAGSIIEAVLLDFLQTADYGAKGKIDPLKMQLQDLIEACKNERVLSNKTVQLSAAVQSYRNLIHPGRLIRLNESVTESGATVVRALLDIILNEVSAKKQDRYGYTAEQLVKKIAQDASATAILPHLLRDMSEEEKCRLMLKIIPARYFELDAESFDPSDIQGRLSECFRSAFDLSTDRTKERVTSHFVDIVKNETQDMVFAYETAFFRASDLKHLATADAQLVKDHLVSRIKNNGMSLRLTSAIDGLGRFLGVNDISPLVDAMVRVATSAKTEPLKEAASSGIVRLWQELPGGPSGTDHQVVERLGDWVAHFEKQGREQQAQIVKDIRVECSDIPF
jgi:hypothetical protein